MTLKSVTNVLVVRGKRQCNTSRRARAALCTKKRRRGASHHRGPQAACGDPVDTIREWSAQLARFPACMSWHDVVAHRVAVPTLLDMSSQKRCRAPHVNLHSLGRELGGRMWSKCSILPHRLYDAVAPPPRIGERRGERRPVRSPPGFASVIHRPPG